MERQKRVAAVHDLSGFGRCSLTVALPIISAAGIETSVIPTAVLSTHTGGIAGYTFRDLTDDLPAFIDHWQSLDLAFDAIYTGYLGSKRQLEIMGDFFDRFRSPSTAVIVDPVMGDNGQYYPLFDDSFAEGMKTLCTRADIVVPNLTEAALLTGGTYRPGPYRRDDIERIIRAVAALGPAQVVLTGVSLREGELGAATYDRRTDRFGLAMGPQIEGSYHGTGDVFASALTAALVRGNDLLRSAEIAVHYTVAAIERTRKAGTDRRYGVDFEGSLPVLMQDLGLLFCDAATME